MVVFSTKECYFCARIVFFSTKKYSMKFAREQGALMAKSDKGGKGSVCLRNILNNIDSLRTRLSDFRPKLAENLIKNLLT